METLLAILLGGVSGLMLGALAIFLVERKINRRTFYFYDDTEEK